MSAEPDRVGVPGPQAPAGACPAPERPRPRRLGPLGALLLALPCAAVLAVPWYDRMQPELFGVPFFYWWQMVWVVLASVCMGLVYRMVVPAGGGD